VFTALVTHSLTQEAIASLSNPTEGMLVAAGEVNATVGGAADGEQDMPELFATGAPGRLLSPCGLAAGATKEKGAELLGAATKGFTPADVTAIGVAIDAGSTNNALVVTAAAAGGAGCMANAPHDFNCLTTLS